MALAVRPLVVSLREQIRECNAVVLTAAAKIRAKKPGQAAELTVATEALLLAVEQMLVCATEMERRHFAGMTACAAQPTMRAFSGAPMLGTPIVRRVATTRGNGTKSTTTRRRAAAKPGKARAAAAAAPARKRKRVAAASAEAAALV
jgi:hypothetical protein